MGRAGIEPATLAVTLTIGKLRRGIALPSYIHLRWTVSRIGSRREVCDPAFSGSSIIRAETDLVSRCRVRLGLGHAAAWLGRRTELQLAPDTDRLDGTAAGALCGQRAGGLGEWQPRYRPENDRRRPDLAAGRPPRHLCTAIRDVEAFDADHAAILSIGTGSDSRVYVTSDGGQHWALTFVNDHPDAFYDCMAFFDRKHGLAVSDPVDGRFRIIVTSDGGRTWRIASGEMPPALPGEFGFAASGECLVTASGRQAWFGTGGAAQARVFHSSDRGEDWQVRATPIHSGPTAGIFALAFRDRRHGFAVGGDFTMPSLAPDALALTSDGGNNWALISDAPNEYRSGASWMTGKVAIVVGPTGSDVSLDQ